MATPYLIESDIDSLPILWYNKLSKFRVFPMMHSKGKERYDGSIQIQYL